MSVISIISKNRILLVFIALMLSSCGKAIDDVTEVEPQIEASVLPSLMLSYTPIYPTSNDTITYTVTSSDTAHELLIGNGIANNQCFNVTTCSLTIHAFYLLKSPNLTYRAYAFDSTGTVIAHASDSSPEIATSKVNIIMTNIGPQTVCQVYILPSPSNSYGGWGIDWLGSNQTIKLNGTHSFSVFPGKYDIMVETCNHKKITQYLDINIPISIDLEVGTGEPAIRSIVIMLHGVNSGPQNLVEFENNIRNRWEKDLAQVKFVYLNWGEDYFWQASDDVGGRAWSSSGMTDRAWRGVFKIKQLVARFRYTLGFEVPITILSHSQGTIITLAALQEGMQVENWILMGSPLDKDNAIPDCEDNTDLGKAAHNVSGSVLNLWSIADDTVRYKGGIGGWGLLTDSNGDWDICNYPYDEYSPKNVIQAQIRDVDHNDWWPVDWYNWTSIPDHKWLQYDPDMFIYLLRGDNVVPDYRVEVLTKAEEDLFEVYTVWAKEVPDSAFDDDYNKFDQDIFLTHDMMAGPYYDDKDLAKYTFSCTQGSAEIQILAAQDYEFDEYTSWLWVVAASPEIEDELEVDSCCDDATVWAQVWGIATGVSRCHLIIEAWNN